MTTETRPTDFELKAIAEMEKIFGNKFTLQPGIFYQHEGGYITSFHLSNGEEYLVKVYADKSLPKVFKLIN